MPRELFVLFFCFRSDQSSPPPPLQSASQRSKTVSRFDMGKKKSFSLWKTVSGNKLKWQAKQTIKFLCDIQTIEWKYSSETRVRNNCIELGERIWKACHCATNNVFVFVVPFNMTRPWFVAFLVRKIMYESHELNEKRLLWVALLSLFFLSLNPHSYVRSLARSCSHPLYT